MKPGVVLAALASSIFSLAPAIGQEADGQTPKNAQIFIGRMVSLGGFQVMGADPGGAWSEGRMDNGQYASFLPAGVIAFAQKDYECTSSVTYYAEYGYAKNMGDWWSTAKNPVLGALHTGASLPDPWSYKEVSERTGRIDWQDVLSVTADGPYVTLRLRNQYGVKLQAPTADLAKRIAFAMEVIRMGCDATSDPVF